MSVQAAVTSDSDFFQAVVPQKTDNSDKNEAPLHGGSKSDFKNVLKDVRNERQRGANAPAGSRTGARQKYTAGVVNAGGRIEENTRPASDPAALEKAGPSLYDESGEQSASRFDPDLILGNLEELNEHDLAITDITAVTADDEPEPEPLDKPPGGDDTPEDGAVKDAGVIPLPEIEAAFPKDGEKIPAGTVPGNDAVNNFEKTDITNAVPPTGADKPEELERAEPVTEEDAGVLFADVLEAENAEPAPAEKNKSVTGHDGENGNLEKGNRADDAPGAKTIQPDLADSDKEAGPADDQAQPASLSEEREQGSNAALSETSTHLGETQASAVNAFGNLTDAGARAEAPAVVRMPVTYTLVSPDKFGEGLLTVVEFMTNGETQRVRIVVEPPALGRVDVSLKSTPTGVEAVFHVDSEALRQMVQNQLDSLKNSLQAQGIHVSGLTVDIRNGEGENRRDERGSSGKNKATRGEDDGNIEDNTRLTRLDLERGLLHWVA